LVGGDIDQMDLIAIDIQRERDVGLGSLNQTRQAIGLAPYGSFAQLTDDPTLQSNLETVYGNINAVDLFIGGLAEPHARGSLVGQTFQAIIARQFRALRAGDRFYWQNQPFDRTTARMIEATTLGKIILRNTDTTSLQPNVFIAAPSAHRKNQVAPDPAH
jgi:peroxidase